MQLPLHVKQLDELADLTDELHLAIGMFDGLHLGHKTVIEPAVLSAQRSGGVSGVLTFDPHPSQLFNPEAPTRLIMPIESKKALLTELGVDIVICKQFDHEFASITAEDFLSVLQTTLPSLKSVYVGENFRFGRKRAGSVATLIESGNRLGIDIFSSERIKHNGEPISSTRIRKELEAGRIEIANELLGYNYRFKGIVTEGKKLGRTIGFPTLNIPWAPDCRPRFGVYYVRFRNVKEARWAPGVANFGIRPTVNQSDQDPLLEIHALEGTSLVSEDAVEVEWLQFIRPEQKFDSIDLLKNQIFRDCENIRKLYDSNG